MRVSVLLAAVMLIASPVWGETRCYTVEHPEYSEAVCTGDEKISPAAGSNVSGAEISGRKGAEVTRSSGTDTQSYQQPEAVRAQPQKQSSVMPPVAQSGSQAVSGAKRESAAEHLARRKALAIQTTGRISGMNGAPAQGER